MLVYEELQGSMAILAQASYSHRNRLWGGMQHWVVSGIDWEDTTRQCEPEVSFAGQNLSVCRTFHTDFEFCDIEVEEQRLGVWIGSA